MTLLNTNFSRGAFAFAASVLAFTAQADGVQSAPANKKNSWTPYVGLGIGYSSVDFKTNNYVLTGGTEAKGASSAAAKGPLESFYAGIHNQYHNFLVGGEVYGYLSQQKAKITSSDSGVPVLLSRSESMKRKYGYGVKVRGGYYVNPMAVAYVHVGLENAKFQYNGSFALAGPVSGSLKKSKTLMGVPVGFGFEMDAASSWKTRLEYTYTQYKSWSPGDAMTAAGDVASSKIKPSQHAVVLGFSYQI